MSERKLDYFGTFLASGATSALPPTPPDPMNAVLKALRSGPRPLKDLLPFTGYSLTAFLEARDQLTRLGLVEAADADALRLTDKGKEIVAVLA